MNIEKPSLVYTLTHTHTQSPKRKHTFVRTEVFKAILTQHYKPRGDGNKSQENVWLLPHTSCRLTLAAVTHHVASHPTG